MSLLILMISIVLLKRWWFLKICEINRFIYYLVFVTIMGIAKVTTNFQVTIPQDIRRTKQIKVGDTVFFTLEGEKVDFFKMDRKTIIEECSGIWKEKISGSSSDYVRELRSEWDKREKREMKK